MSKNEEVRDFLREMGWIMVILFIGFSVMLLTWPIGFQISNWGWP